MSRISDILDQLTAGMRALDPQSETDDCFDCPEDGYGSVKAPQDWIKDHRRTMRQFDIRNTGMLPGEGTNNLLNNSAIRIVYPLSIDHGYLDRIMQEDVRTILIGVLRNPAYWGSAYSVGISGGPTLEIVVDGNGVEHNVVMAIPIQISYALECSGEETYHAEVVRWAESDAHRATLCAQLRDSKGRPVRQSRLVNLTTYNADWTNVEPTFWADPSEFQTVIKAGTADVCAGIYTDSDGFFQVTFFYDGIDLDKTQKVRLQVDGQNRKVDTDLISLTGQRIFVDGVDGVDVIGGGTEADPFKTISFASDQVDGTNRGLGQITTICVVRAGLYAWDDSNYFRGVSIVGLVDGVQVQGRARIYSLYSGRLPLLRNVEALPGADLSALSVYSYSRAIIADVRVPDASAIAYAIRKDSQSQDPVLLVGCTVGAGSSVGVLFGGEGFAKNRAMMHCTLTGTPSYFVQGASLLNLGVMVYDCTFTGNVFQFLNLTNETVFMGDRNTYVGALGTRFSSINSVDYATFAEHQAALVPYEQNSTWAAA